MGTTGPMWILESYMQINLLEYGILEQIFLFFIKIGSTMVTAEHFDLLTAS
jgi:hypothetical protein